MVPGDKGMSVHVVLSFERLTLSKPGSFKEPTSSLVCSLNLRSLITKVVVAFPSNHKKFLTFSLVGKGPFSLFFPL